MQRLETRNLNVLFSVTMVLVMVLVIVMLVWRVQGSVKQFDDFQNQMMQKQAQVTATDISELVTSIRNRMVAISLDDFFLKDFEEFKSVEPLQEALQARLKNYFPEMFAFSIADKHGEPLAGDVHMLVGDICRADLQHTAHLLDQKKTDELYEPWIHPQPDGYHFDMMFPARAFGETLVFFMSFKADLLQNALNQKVFTEHTIYLLRVDKPGLIEVAQQGVRNTLTRDFYLTDFEQALISARVPVDGTRWEVAVLANPAVRSEFIDENIQDTLMLFSVFAVFWSLLFLFGLYEENRKGRLMSYLHHLSSHDALTELANRRFLYSAFKESLNNKRFAGELAGLLYLDLNDFKPINDEYGHEVGDELLKLVAKRLLACSRQHDVVARVGGDEFVVLLNHLGQEKEQALHALNEAKTRFSLHLEPEYNINTLHLNAQASIGLALLEDESRSLDALLKEADEKMYEAKVRFKQAR